MSLRSKIVSLLFAVVLTYGASDYWVQRREIAPIFDMVERDEAREDLFRVQRALQNEVAELVRVCHLLSSWDATFEFAGGSREAADTLELGPEALERYDLDLLYIADARGEVLWGAARGPETEAAVQVPRLLSDALVLNRVLPRGDGDEAKDGIYVPGGERAGLRQTALGPLLVSSNPILDSQEQGMPRGVVLVARFLTEERRSEVAERTQVSFDLWPLDGKLAADVSEEVIDSVTSSTEPILVEGSRDLLYAFLALEDMREAPAFLLRANIDRIITRGGATALRYALNSTVVAGLILLLTLLYLLQRTVLRPLSMLTQHALRIGRTEDLFTRLDLDRADEVGILSREFDNMTERLARSREDLVGAARAAGMSEIATGILHNVGNVLNSVNISAALVSQRLTELQAIDDLQAIVAVLDEHAEDLAEFVSSSPQGQHLRPFLREIAQSIAEDREIIVEEAQGLSVGVDHIRELIQSQQSFAGRTALIEPVLVDELVEEAFTISDRALTHDSGLVVVRELTDLPRAFADRHRILEILVNLIQNARQSLTESGHEQRQLVLRSRRLEDTFELEVEDDGVGFTADVQDRMFSMGFTTKAGGHGFGLHASANAAREMGGSLRAKSRGPGQGATFTLSLPFETARSLEANS